MKQALFAAAMIIATAAAAQAAPAADATKRLGTFGNWDVLTFSDGPAKTCYLAAAASKVQGGEKGAKTTTHLTVTHRSGGKSLDEVSISGVYGFKKDSKVELRVGAKPHGLFTKGDRAWGEDAKADKAIVESLRKGKEALMLATPAKGADITATFSLSGFSDALAAADKACAVKR
jgi:invasion protein IalB